MRTKVKSNIALLLVIVMLPVLAITLVACNDDVITSFDTRGGGEISDVKGEVSDEPIPVRDGYTFLGWYLNADGSGERVVFPFNPDSDTTLYAKWEKKGFGGGSEKEDYVKILIDAIKSSYLIGNSEPLGGSFGVEIGNLKLGADIYIDEENPEAFKMSFTGSGAVDFSFYADDENFYAVGENFKKRFKDCSVGDLIADSVPTSAETSSVMLVLEIAFGLVFPNELAYENAEGAYVYPVDLEGAFEAISGLGIAIPEELSSVLGAVDLSLTAKIEDGKIASGAIGLGVAGLISGEVKVTEARLENGYDPQISTPAKDDPSFDETNILNFTLEGDVTLTDKLSDYSEKDLATYHYEIRFDYSLVSALKAAFSGAEFDGSVFFDQPDSKIMLSLYHRCDASCEEFCSGKEGASRGSVLTAVYSPQDFDTNNFYVALNLKALLPKGFISKLIDTGSINILSLFDEYVPLTIDLGALIYNAQHTSVTETAVAEAQAAEESSSSLSLENNILGIVFDVFDFLSTITVSDDDGFSLGVNELLDILDLEAGGKNIANLIQPFFGTADFLRIKVDNAVYGDPTTAEIDMFREFMLIAEYVGDYKNFGNYIPAKTIDWQRGNDGNVIMTAGELSTHDADGNPVKLTAAEWMTILSTGSAKYSYELVNGTGGETSVAILGAYNVDFTAYGKAQPIVVTTSLADGTGISGILNLLTIVGINLEIHANMFETEITITEATVEFYQPDTILVDGEEVPNNKYDPDKVYDYRDLLNPEFIAKITYSDGTTKEAAVQPEEISSNFYNYNNKEAAAVDAFSTFDLHYSAYGEEFVLTVTMRDMLVEADPERIELEPQSSYIISNSGHKATYIDANGETKTASVSGSEGIMSVTAPDGVTVETYYTTVLGMQIFKGFNLTFPNEGEYLVDVYVGKGYTKQYLFVVEEPVTIPGYEISGEYTGLGEVTATIKRADQSGSGLNGVLKVEFGGVELVSGEDYKLYAADGSEVDSFFLEALMFNPMTLRIELMKEEYFGAGLKVSLLSPDYENAVVSEFELPDIVGSYDFSAGLAEVEGYTTDGTLIKISPRSTTPFAGEHTLKVYYRADAASDWTEVEFKVGLIQTYTDSGRVSFRNAYDTVYVNASGLSEAKLSSGYTSNYAQYIEIDADAAIAAGGEIKVELTAPETFGSIVVGSVTFTVPAEEVTEETV